MSIIHPNEHINKNWFIICNNFDFGLSYTTFEYRNLKHSKQTFTSTDSLKISIDVPKTGKPVRQRFSYCKCQ